MLTQAEQDDLREDLKQTVEIARQTELIDRRELIFVLRLAEAYVGAAIAQGTLVNCVMPPESALARISDLRKRLEQ